MMLNTIANRPNRPNHSNLPPGTHTAPGLGLGAYSNVNDHLFLGKTTAEIEALMRMYQGDSYSAANDPSTRLFTDPAYRAAVTKPFAQSNLSTVDFHTINQSTGVPEYSTRSTGVVSESDANRIAGLLGATVQPEPRLIGQQQQDYTIVMPSGATFNASDLASRFNAAKTPEQVYLLNKDIASLAGSQIEKARSVQSEVLRSDTYLRNIREGQASATKAGAAAVATAIVNRPISGPPNRATPVETSFIDELVNWFKSFSSEGPTGGTATRTNTGTHTGTGTRPAQYPIEGLLDNPLLLVGVAAGLYLLLGRK